MDVAFLLGDGLCSEEGVGAGDKDGVADGDFVVGDAKRDKALESETPSVSPPLKGENSSLP